MIFPKDDPQVVIEFDEPLYVDSESIVKIRFKPIDLVYEGSGLLYESEKELLECKAKLVDREAELEAIHQSKSWKLTKAFRREKA